MNTRYLELTRDWLRRLPTMAFDLGSVTSYQMDQAIQSPDAINWLGKAPEEYKCGATGCVVGWLPIILRKEPIAARLTYNSKYGGVEYLESDGGVLTDGSFDQIAIGVFDVPLDVAHHLCNPSNYPDGADTEATVVADRIDRLLQHADDTEAQLQEYVCAAEDSDFWAAKYFDKAPHPDNVE